MVTECCFSCGVLFGLPEELYKILQNNPDKYFYCPNGHSQHYVKSQEAVRREQVEKLLREKEHQLIMSANQKLELEQQLKKVNNKLKRVSKGVCPCCNRTFIDLQRHMKTKHPEVVKPK